MSPDGTSLDQNASQNLSQTASVDQLSTKALPNSRKFYVTGSRDDIRVGMREVTQSPTHLRDGELEDTPPYASMTPPAPIRTRT